MLANGDDRRCGDDEMVDDQPRERLGVRQAQRRILRHRGADHARATGHDDVRIAVVSRDEVGQPNRAGRPSAIDDLHRPWRELSERNRALHEPGDLVGSAARVCRRHDGEGP